MPRSRDRLLPVAIGFLALALALLVGVGLTGPAQADDPAPAPAPDDDPVAGEDPVPAENPAPDDVPGVAGQTRSALPVHARRAVSAQPEAAQASRAFLRGHGPAGLAAFVEVHREALDAIEARYRGQGRFSLVGRSPRVVIVPAGSSPEAMKAAEEAAANAQAREERLLEALDAIAGQTDALGGRLFWHTDLRQAQRIARASGKPILHLRLLGRLDEMHSCANSRFFRATLYPDAAVAKILRERYVLHWETVRPVPRITIDFGDGRVLEKTITGNSAHYVLDHELRVLDVMPGLVHAKRFAEWLTAGDALRQEMAEVEPAAWGSHMAQIHFAKMRELAQRWNDQFGGFHLSIVQVADDAGPPDVMGAFQALRGATSTEWWTRFSARHLEDSRVAPEVMAHLRRTWTPPAREAGRLAVTKSIGEDPMLEAIRGLEQSIAEDTARNLFDLRAQALDLLRRGPTQDRDSLNTEIYARIFKMPLHDPWLGLEPGAFDALR